ncbi:MAG TPA: ubiquinone/menaquinone biosynthesis methyltransferase [Bellilinea sp.]|nr:ubiquinone/menaquinone biosynthesis methyltransferase [Bellilinea sp.]
MRSKPVTEREREAAQVQKMFARIAPRYDLMNKLMTGFQDIRWRREVLRRADLHPGDLLFDLGAGTGDLARQTLKDHPGVNVVAADFTTQMMLTGRETHKLNPDFTTADALHTPFMDGQFDAVVSGFLLRNVTDLPAALAEQFRILKPGGRFLSLDTTQPTPNLFSPLIRFHMRVVIPWLGGLITGQRQAYTYLPSTSEHFLKAESLAELLSSTGFKNVCFVRRNLGTIAIHWGVKPL